MPPEITAQEPSRPVKKTPGADIPFGVNEVRLNASQWLVALIIIALVLLLAPRLWTKLERFDTGADYRIPYHLSKDYWLYSRRLDQATDPAQILVLGDSVVWGEYVLPNGTLSYFLDQEAKATNRFINCGLNGLFPLAQEGLVSYYSPTLKHRKIIVQHNVLWMTSPKADLSTSKEEQFNHSRLVPQFPLNMPTNGGWFFGIVSRMVPQFPPRLPCYRADANERLTAAIEREVPFFAWVGHLQNAYFEQKSILKWTLEGDDQTPPRYPNGYKNPLVQITLSVPAAPLDDPQRGPKSARHKPWSSQGQNTTSFEWVGLESSLQWQAFQRVISLLRQRENDILVVVGPFNDHMVSEENRPALVAIRKGIATWLAQQQLAHLIPDPLPSDLYADASHPLTEGYARLARQLYATDTFQKWLKAE
jgi:hypothetical protein